MTRLRLFQFFRVTWTAGWALVCLLLVVLWVRSQQTADVLHVRLDSKGGGIAAIAIGSIDGTMTFFRSAGPRRPFNYYLLLNSERKGSQDRGMWAMQAQRPPDWNAFGFGVLRNPGFNVYAAPHWFYALHAAIMGAAPWLLFRFSLRTLLIAVMLIAVVLGVVTTSLR
jgi:hypothetical protein